MKKNLRVIQINGFRGLFLTIFIVSCLAAGFILFPSFVLMQVWNYLAIKTASMSTINLLGGGLLWGIIALSIYIFNKKKLIVSFNSQQELSDDEIKEVMNKIKTQPIKHNIVIQKEFSSDEKDLVKEPDVKTEKQ